MLLVGVFQSKVTRSCPVAVVVVVLVVLVVVLVVVVVPVAVVTGPTAAPDTSTTRECSSIRSGFGVTNAFPWIADDTWGGNLVTSSRRLNRVWYPQVTPSPCP